MSREINLTDTTLLVNSANNKLKIFFLIFPQKTTLEMICMRYHKSCFLGKIWKNVTNFLSSELARRGLKIKNYIISSIYYILTDLWRCINSTSWNSTSNNNDVTLFTLTGGYGCWCWCWTLGIWVNARIEHIGIACNAQSTFCKIKESQFQIKWYTTTSV